jgi:hypothetical protein
MNTRISVSFQADKCWSPVLWFPNSRWLGRPRLAASGDCDTCYYLWRLRPMTGRGFTLLNFNATVWKKSQGSKKACCGILEGARIFFEGIKWFFFEKWVFFIPWVSISYQSVRNFRRFEIFDFFFLMVTCYCLEEVPRPIASPVASTSLMKREWRTHDIIDKRRYTYKIFLKGSMKWFFLKKIMKWFAS